MKPVHVLLPLKDLVAAKTRLSGLLSPSERRALAQAMVEDVLGMLSQHAAVNTLTLVSDDPSAHLLADRYGLVLLPEVELGVSGLNAVLEAATLNMGLAPEERLLILHGDIPLFNAGELDAVLAALAAQPGLVIGCDRHRSGTNLLAFTLADKPAYGFGRDSCRRHQAAAAAKSTPCTTLCLPGLGLDVDEPADLGLLLRGLEPESRRGYTRDLLVDTELGRRLALALQTGTDAEGQAREKR